MTQEDQDMASPPNTIAPIYGRGEEKIGCENGDGGLGKKNHGASASASEAWMKSVEGEIKLLRSDNELMKGENKSLQDKFKTLEDNIKTLMLLNDVDEPSTSVTSDSDLLTVESDGTSNGADGDHAAVSFITTEVKATAAKQTTKKKKPKKKKKGSKVAKYFGVGGSLAKVVGGALKKKLTVGLLSIAMLIFLSIGQGLMIGGSSSPFRSDKSARAIARERIREMIGVAKKHGGKEAPPDAVPVDHEGSATGREDKEEFWSRILQENSLFGSNTDGPTASSDSSGPTASSTTATSPAPMVTSSDQTSSDHPSMTPSKDRAAESIALPTFATADYPPKLSPGFVCNADINACGCPDMYQADYRGTISTTISGFECKSWGDYLRNIYPNTGLEENFCRNPPGYIGGAWCESTNPEVEVGLELCDVPDCGSIPTASPTTANPTSSSKPSVSASPSVIPTLSQSPTQTCQVADKMKCGCQIQLKSDYRGSISTTTEGIECELWDAELLNQYMKSIFDIVGGYPAVYPNAGLEDNFCRNPGLEGDSPWCFLPTPPVDGVPVKGECFVPECDPCSCMPPCGEPNLETCGCPSALQADSCCDEEDAGCKCTYLKDACRKSLEIGNNTDFCDIAEAECCKDKDDPNCKCNMFERICSEGPSQSTCDVAATRCCENSRVGKDVCLCDFYAHAETFMIYGGESKSDDCRTTFETPSFEKAMLEGIYKAGGGDYWFINTGWLEEDVRHCDWFGVVCDGGFVTEINMRNNNLTNLTHMQFSRLTKLDIAENKLSGTWESDYHRLNPKVTHIDISGNQFSGHADISFPSTTLHVNFSNNNFTSIGFKRFNAAYKTLQILDMSNNRINQDTYEVFLNIPPSLERLILSNNAIEGTLPNPFPLPNIKHLAIADNNINGPLPDFSGSPRLMVLDLSNQKQTGMGGLTRILPTSIYAADIQILDLSANKLTGSIPTGFFKRLRVINLSSNALSGSIPEELGRLDGLLEVLDLSMNKLTGLIPLELNNIEFASVRLSGNADILSPAPLTQCTAENFDLMNDKRLCPPERTALKAFYDASKGPEWTVDYMWLDEYESHCKWHGVKCNPANSSVELVLDNNGLSGTLSKDISELSALEKLDLSDNNIKGLIPTELGLLSQLSHLRLNFNSFKGNDTNFGSLKHLEVIQIQSNRLSGTIPLLNLTFSEEHSFVADCGNPSDFDESLTCEECAMCCNNQDDCYPKEQTGIQKLGFKNYVWFTAAFFLCLLIVSCALAGMSSIYDKHRKHNLSRSSIHPPSSTDKDSKYALDTIGDDSVYQFVLGNSVSGWFIVLVTIGMQIWMLLVFVQGAETDLSDDKSDLAYTYKCPRDQIECKNTSDVDWQGWTVFIVLMVTHLSKDIINGLKLTLLSAKGRHSSHARMRFFFGGWLLTTITALTIYVSTIYNYAIGTSNTELIMNSVVILFFADVDELLYDALMAISPSWVESMSYQEDEESVIELGRHEQDEEEDVIKVEVQQESNQQNAQNMACDVGGLKRDVKRLQERLDILQGGSAGLNDRPMTPQDYRV